MDRSSHLLRSEFQWDLGYFIRFDGGRDPPNPAIRVRDQRDWLGEGGTNSNGEDTPVQRVRIVSSSPAPTGGRSNVRLWPRDWLSGFQISLPNRLVD